MRPADQQKLTNAITLILIYGPFWRVKNYLQGNDQPQIRLTKNTEPSKFLPVLPSEAHDGIRGAAVQISFDNKQK